MGAKGPLFELEADPGQLPAQRLLEAGERSVRVIDAYPDRPWPLRVWKGTNRAARDLDGYARAGGSPAHRVGDRLDRLLPAVSEKLQGHVEVRLRDPAHASRPEPSAECASGRNDRLVRLFCRVNRRE